MWIEGGVYDVEPETAVNAHLKGCRVCILGYVDLLVQAARYGHLYNFARPVLRI